MGGNGENDFPRHNVGRRLGRVDRVAGQPLEIGHDRGAAVRTGNARVGLLGENALGSVVGDHLQQVGDCGSFSWVFQLYQFEQLAVGLE